MDVNLNSITGIPYSTNYLTNLGTNPTVLLVITVIIILYYVLFASLGVAKGQPIGETVSNSAQGIVMLEVLLWGVFVVLLLLNGMSYIFNIDITASIKNLFTAIPEIDIKVDTAEVPQDDVIPETTVQELTTAKQVFHVPGNKYTYENSKAICKAYGGRLANYDEINKAYDEGADWCSYGWSDKQMALFPTQKEKWEHLQKIKGHEHDCGRQGINGGYIANPNVRFGVNCYGYKPKITKEEVDLMANTPLYPRTQREIDFDKRVNYWRDKLPEILVAPFNNNNWSII
jgi:hypothetical protein